MHRLIGSGELIEMRGIHLPKHFDVSHCQMLNAACASHFTSGPNPKLGQGQVWSWARTLSLGTSASTRHFEECLRAQWGRRKAMDNPSTSAPVHLKIIHLALIGLPSTYRSYEKFLNSSQVTLNKVKIVFQCHLFVDLNSSSDSLGPSS